MKRLFIYLGVGIGIAVPFLFSSANVQDELQKRNQQIQEIERQIEAYQQQIVENGSKAKTLNAEIGRLDAQIGKLQLEIKSLGLAIDQTNGEIGQTQEQIHTAQEKITLHKKALAKYIQSLYQVESENLIEVLLKNDELSDFFNNLKSLEDTQNGVQEAISAIKDLKTDLEVKEDQLLDKKGELQSLKNLQLSEKTNLDSTKGQKSKLLQQTKGEEKRYQQLVEVSKKDIERIREQITYLQQNGVSAEDAVKFGQLTAVRVGIRPAFLLAILEVETRLGKNVGTGNWKKDMYDCYLRLKKPSRAEAEKKAFFEITSKLGLDPDSVKVSREPSYGCGGAMGPAQFIPTTWLAYESEVARITGHNPPSPWNIEDAFMASAIKLSKGGATSKNRAGEIAAAKAYISGNSKCSTSTCNYYANAVQNKAALIEQNL